jgi:hypothetical protein
MDITYNITVAGGSSASETATDALRGTWGRLKQIYR